MTNSRYIHSYIDKRMMTEQAELLAIRNVAIKHHIPIISDEVAAFLCAELAVIGPTTALEIGTAIGYSGILILMNSGSDLTTIEIEPDLAAVAQRHFAKLGLSARVRQLIGDASEVLRQLQDEERRYDVIFIDAAKGHYLDYFKTCEQLLAERGVIIADNVLFKGYVAGAPHPRRQRTIISRMNAFIDYVNQHPDYLCSLLSIGDGVLLAVRT